MLYILSTLQKIKDYQLMHYYCVIYIDYKCRQINSNEHEVAYTLPNVVATSMQKNLFIFIDNS